MSKIIKLNNTIVASAENTIHYIYDIDKRFEHYFNERLFVQYDFDLAEVPDAILNIPFVANLYPMCWFLGATLHVKTLDRNFFLSIEKIKLEFAKFHPEILARNSKLIVEDFKTIDYPSNNSSMLFSGGVDALYTFSKLDIPKLELVTIHGADIDIHNKEQWKKISDITKALPLTEQNPNHFIRSNVRSFYSSRAEKLIYNNTQDWWSLIQHGLALTTLIAPISYKNGVGKVYIGSTLDSLNNHIPWGSSAIDNFIAWGSTKVIHHGQEANRFEKMKFLCGFFDAINMPTPFRVCYDQLNDKLNCSKCTKCNRAILSLIILGKDPRKFGFEIETEGNSVAVFYNDLIQSIQQNVFQQNVYFYWLEILEELEQHTVVPFVFFDKKD